MSIRLHAGENAVADLYKTGGARLSILPAAGFDRPASHPCGPEAQALLTDWQESIKRLV